MYSGNVRVGGIFNGKRCEPLADALAQERNFEPPVHTGKGLQLGEPGLKQGLGAAAVLARVVVERRRHLNQALEKCLIRSGRR